MSGRVQIALLAPLSCRMNNTLPRQSSSAGQPSVVTAARSESCLPRTTSGVTIWPVANPDRSTRVELVEALGVDVFDSAVEPGAFLLQLEEEGDGHVAGMGLGPAAHR